MADVKIATMSKVLSRDSSREGCVMAREPRFPGIVWWCDNCGACLSDQKGFDDHKYTWKCRECGFKNSISWDNICSGDSAATKLLLHILGFMSYVGLWTSIMLGVSMIAFKADTKVYLFPFLICLGMYLVSFVATILVDFGLRHVPFSTKNLVGIILRNLREDLLSPIMFVKELLSNLLSFITHLLPFPKKYKWHSNKVIVAFAILYVLIAVAEVVAFCRINGFAARDFASFVNNLISRLK